MIVDALLLDLAMDYRLPYYKIKIRTRDQVYYGQFSEVFLLNFPIKATIDTYTEGNWPKYCRGEWPSFEPIEIVSTDIEHIELVGFVPTQNRKPDPIKKGTNRLTVSYHAYKDTLSHWNLKALGIQNATPLLIYPQHPLFQSRGITGAY